ncbi:MAG: hypothetical protein JWP38_3765 [Herbaspirillum sp.]|nr:hypothetical protein [Herbaspirillum sp.]
METTDISVARIEKAWQADHGETVELIVTLGDGRRAALQFPYEIVLRAVTALHYGARKAAAERVATSGEQAQSFHFSGGAVRQVVNFTIEHAINAKTDAVDVLLQIATQDGELMSYLISTELADDLAKRLLKPD